jgi:hypothetical protein
MLRPIFPGTSEVDQMYKICAILGSPSPAEWPEGYKLAAKINFQFPKFVQTEMQSIIPNASQEALDLIDQMLQFDP